MSAEESKKNFIESCKTVFYNGYSSIKKDIVLFGAGAYGKMMKKALQDICNKEVIAFCDNDSEKWGSNLEGVPIEKIETVVEKYNDFIIVISSQFDSAVRKSLADFDVEIFDKPYGDVCTCIVPFIEECLIHYVYETTPLDLLDPMSWIDEYYEKFAGKEEEVLKILVDEQSQDIVNKRALFYKTGDVDYLKQIPISPKQYFAQEYYQIGNDEVYVDCGAYDGDSIEKFISATGNQYDKIYAFEADSNNYKKLQKKAESFGNNRIKLFNYAVGEKEEVVRFRSLGTTGSYIDDSGDVEMRVKRLDDVIKERVSLIKMDIEGVELAALKGAEHIIKTYKPKLAISIYHKCEDMFTIPMRLHKLVPEYRFKVRQHEPFSLWEMVLYAEA